MLHKDFGNNRGKRIPHGFSLFVEDPSKIKEGWCKANVNEVDTFRADKVGEHVKGFEHRDLGE